MGSRHITRGLNLLNARREDFEILKALSKYTMFISTCLAILLRYQLMGLTNVRSLEVNLSCNVFVAGSICAK